MEEIIFITSNENKLKEARSILPDIKIISKKIDLLEIQSVQLEDVIKEKLKYGFQQIKKPIIVEDTGLFFNGLNGFPGALIKMLLDSVGCEGCFKIINAFEDKSAIAKCAVGFTSDGKDLKVFIGEIKGTIVNPKGSSNFGWDPIFQPEGLDKTFAEMNPEEKNAISHRYKALKKFKEFLNNEQGL